MEFLKGIEWYRHVDPVDQSTWLGPNDRNNMYLEVYLPFPWMGKFYTKFEKEVNNEIAFNWMVRATPILPVGMAVMYLAMCYFGPKIMANRKAFDLKGPLAYWNLFLALFSFVGMVRTVPHLLWLWSLMGFHEVACGTPEPLYGTTAIGLWNQAFVLSKLFELVDTVFIILRKRPLSFLHWYHHLTVMLFCWFTYVNENPGLTFVAMNYTVHSVMYFYYYLTAIKAWPKWLNPQFITVMQISQMVVGVACAVHYVGVFTKGQTCAMQKETMIACAVMYSTYLYLFAEFFVKRFIFKNTLLSPTHTPTKKDA